VRDLQPEGERVSLVFAQVAAALARSTSSLLSGDPELGQVVIDGDRQITSLTAEIESSGLAATQVGAA
jgi:hypothetical protein